MELIKDYLGVLLVTVFVLLVVKWVYRQSKKKAKYAHIPAPGKLFWFGAGVNLITSKSPYPHVPKTAVALQTLRGIALLMHEEGMYHLSFGNRLILFLYAPKTVESILSSKIEIEKSSLYKLGEKYIGGGLLLNKGDEWRRNRKLLTPSFHFRVLEDYIPIMNEQAKIFIEKLTERMDDEFLNITEYALKLTFDIILETAMGFSLGAQKTENCEFLNSVEKVLSIWLERAVIPSNNIEFIFNRLPVAKEMSKHGAFIKKFCAEVIKNKKAKLAANQSNGINNNVGKDGELVHKRQAFLDILLSHQMSGNTNYTDEAVNGETLLFIGAGHDTTAVSVSWCVFLLGVNQDIQDKVYEEVHEIFGDDVDGPILPHHMARMKYLECCIKESQRLYPSISHIARKLRSDLDIDGKVVPKNTTVIILVDVLHRNPEVFPNPELFDPDRFLPDNASGRHPYAFIPFSAGPRNCIGQKFAMMEEKIILSNLIRNFKIKSLDPRDKVMNYPQIVNKPNLPLRIKLTPRVS